MFRRLCRERDSDFEDFCRKRNVQILDLGTEGNKEPFVEIDSKVLQTALSHISGQRNVRAQKQND